MDFNTKLSRQNMINILSQTEEFIIIGLTGRNGAGCTEASKIFSYSYKELELPDINPGSNGFIDNTERERRILQRYAQSHWLKFDVIKSKAIISTFLLKNFEEFISQIDNKKFTKKTLYEAMKKNADISFSDSLFAIAENEKFKSNLTEIFNRIGLSEEQTTIFQQLGVELTKPNADLKVLLNYCVAACNALDEFYLIAQTKDFIKKPTQMLADLEILLIQLSAIVKNIVINTHNFETIWEFLRNMNNILETNPSENKETETDEEKLQRFQCFIFAHDLMPALGNAIYEGLLNAGISYTKLFQKFGNSIRCYGEIKYEIEIDEDTISKNNVGIYAIPQKIVQFIKALRHPFSKYCRPVRIVIDSIKSVFEATYLRQRYSSFYLFAISAEEQIRKNRSLNGENKKLSLREITFTDWNEYSSDGYKIYKEYKDNENKFNNTTDDICEFYKTVTDASEPLMHDPVRKYAYDNKLHQFYLQDVAASIENADVFISNNDQNDILKNMNLRWEIVRNVCLIMFPGLVPPTPIERCMQIAFAAKCNSGCLSRQVGAVVTDSNYNILSVGWNDVPCGDISCSFKNIIDLCKLEDRQAYTEYELHNSKFRDIIRPLSLNLHNLNNVHTMLRGLPFRYCFKDLHNSNKPSSNPMHSRAMHAEEKALSACGNTCEGGYLFTTSSPCEMCSKNAKNHKISKIYYIELYPGISESQYSCSGDPNNIAEHILFTGAIGRAYTQLYTPILPHKDILELLGIFDEFYPGNKK